MAHCYREDCIHKKICYEVNALHCRNDFIWYSGESGCPHYNSTDDVVPRAEVAREIFEEIEKYYCINKFGEAYVHFDSIEEIKKKYTGEV